MATVKADVKNLETLIKDNEMVLIDFWAPWCGPCRAFGPTFEKVSEEYPDFTFAKSNTQDDPELAGQFGVRSIPTLAIFRQGVLLYLEAGALPQNALVEIIEKVKELDMDEVRKEIEENKGK